MRGNLTQERERHSSRGAVSKMADPRFTEAVRNKNALTALVNSEGWEIVDKVWQEREANLLAEFMRDDADYSDAKLREFRIGLKLIRTLRMTPAAMLDDAATVITEYVDEEDQPHGEEEGSGHPDS